MAGKHIGEFEQLVLLATLRQGKRAYAPGIRKELEQRAGRSVSRGALYHTFDRLEVKGYLTSDFEAADDVPDRGGQPLRRFHVSETGVEALKRSRAVLSDMWDGLDSVLGGL